jgi:molecular chaperone GrpE (heat shock protein)
MSERRQLWETLAAFLAQLEKETDAALDEDARLSTVLEDLKDEVRKLGKAQFKANAMVEDQSARWGQIIVEAQAARGQQAELVEQMAEKQVAARERELLEAFLPALDGLENAIASGRRYLAIRDRAAGVPNITSKQAVLVSPADRAMLIGWLDGLRLVRERMLAILEAGGVTPISTVGHPFDPYLHVAVGTVGEGDGPPGTIVAEERRGYRCPSGVLRYAEVIVYRPRR